MRQMYTQELTHLGNQLARLSHQVSRAIDRACAALIEGDVALAEQTIDADERIDEMADAVDASCLDLLALQAPVASDLRLIVTALRLTGTLERMGDLARNIAVIARHAQPVSQLPDEVARTITQMADQARNVGADVKNLMSEPGVEAALDIQTQDDLMDDLHVELRRLLLSPNVELTRSAVVDLTLVGRYFERFGDHSTKVGRRVIFMLEGQRLQ